MITDVIAIRTIEDVTVKNVSIEELKGWWFRARSLPGQDNQHELVFTFFTIRYFRISETQWLSVLV